MAIQVYCNCGNPLFVPAELGGRKIKCANCGDTLKVPQPDANAPADPEEGEKLQQSGRYDVLDAAGKVVKRSTEAPAGKKPDAPKGGAVQLSCPACGGKVEIDDMACLSCGAMLAGGRSGGGGSGILGSVPRPVLFMVLAVLGLGGVGLAAYKAWIASRPGSYLGEGMAAMEERNNVAAREAFLKVLEYDPQNPDAIVKLGELAVITRNKNDLKVWVQKAIGLAKEKPLKAKLQLAWAVYLLDNEKYREAWNMANDAKTNDNSISGVPAIQGVSALHLYEGPKANEESYKHFKEALAEGEQKDWRVYFHLGRVQMLKKELDDARPNIERALQMEEGKAEVWEAASQLREMAGDEEGARTALKKVVELDTENEPAHTRLSRLYYAAGMYDDARRMAEKAKLLKPDLPGPALAVGRACLKLGALAPAKEELERAAKMNAGWEADFLLGECYYRMKDLKSGQSFITKGLGARREDAALHLHAGRVAREAGDQKSAAEFLTQSVRIDGRNYDARVELARVLGATDELRRRNDKVILENLDVAKEQAATRAEAWFELGAQHVAMGRGKEALSAVERGLTHNPGHVELTFQKGRAHLTAEQWRKAQEAFEEVKRISPGYKESEVQMLLAEAVDKVFYNGDEGRPGGN